MPEDQVGPQPGPQTDFLSSAAEIVVFGGSAGGGKSWNLLYEPLRNVTHNSRFSAVIFRRNMTEHRKPGATWDESIVLYGQIKGAKPTQHNLEWRFEGGGKVVMAHLEYANTVLEWHSAQIPLIEFDELTEFLPSQFWYMLSRNRSMSGVPGYIRATCNPDANSWVAELISWYIDQETGFPIPERSGVIRYFLRVGDELIWRDNKEDLKPELLGLPTHDRDGNELPYMPKSFTFIRSDIYDNQILLKQNPEYLANLLALPTVERERLLKGNWKIKPAAGLYFKREWVKIIPFHQVPFKLVKKRGWDLAATEKTQLNSPDWTCGTKIGKDDAGNYYILDHTYIRRSPAGVKSHLQIMAAGDGREVIQYLPQDPGQAGKWQTSALREALDGYPVETSLETGDKGVRFGPFSSMAQTGKVFVVEGEWNERWLSTLEGFNPEDKNGLDDDVDSTSRAFNAFLDSSTGLLEFYKQQAAENLKAKMIERMPTTIAEGGVKIRPPSANTNVIYDMRGNPVWIGGDGCFIVDQKHADFLKRSGFVIKEAEVIDFEEAVRELAKAS